MVKGYVQIFDTDILLTQRRNLVTLEGRHFFQQKATDLGDLVNFKLTHFAIGDGGVDPHNLFLPVMPQETDTSLRSPIILDQANNLTYLPFTSITHYDRTQTVIEIRIEAEHGPEQFFYSEAGLFASNPTRDVFKLVARVTFPSVYKDRSRRQTLYWWLFF